MTVGQAARLDFDLMDCPERLNGPHCPHQIGERAHSATIRCCWCGVDWTEPRSLSYDHHGPYQPSRTREGGSKT